MKKNQKKHKIQVILIVVALIVGSSFIVSKISSGKLYASSSVSPICPAGTQGCIGTESTETVITQATCVTNGSKTVTCSTCKKSQTVTILATGEHDWTDWFFENDEKKPTCQHKGVEMRVCFNCRTYEERDVGKVSHHNYVYKFISNGTHAQKCEWCEVTLEGSEETCTYENGRYVCTACGAYACPASNPTCSGGQREDSIVREAKCTVEGMKNIVCSTCKGIIESNIILQATGHTYANGICTVCGAAQPTTPGGDPNPGGDPDPDPGDGGDTEPELSGITTYKVNDKNMTNVKIATKASELIKTIQDANEGATVTIFNSNNEAVSEDETLATGMRIEVTIGDTKYDITIVIKGDTDGNGKAELLDIIKMNKHRLNKLQLEDAYLQAADVNGDGKVDLLDIIKLNKFRLNKITEL